MNIAILGSTGMIGSATTLFLSEIKCSVIEVNRQGISITGDNQVRRFDVMRDSVKTLLESFPAETVIVNLIGMIRHKIAENSETSLAEAKRVNTDFPKELVSHAQDLGIRVIQIATDCVYSGKEGFYSEDSKMDPIDTYGESKAKGEILSENLLTLRVSIVGREEKNHLELMDWIDAHPRNSQVSGYTNHYWNGISSLHFAKILDGILSNNTILNGTFHIVPSDSVSKFELIKMIADFSGRKDLKIIQTAAEKRIDRRLSSINIKNNSEFWNWAGYQVIPSIRMMLDEYFAWIRPNEQGE
jgi:dTDP-4-dehydrorhamnose reductase